MVNTRKRRPFIDRPHRWPLPSAIALMATMTASCGGSSDGGGEVPPPKSPFKFQSLESASNAPAMFTQPRAGVPLADGSVALLATVEGLPESQTQLGGERIGVLLQAPGGAPPTVLYSGDGMVNPFDIDASLDGTTLYVADSVGGRGERRSDLVVVDRGRRANRARGRLPTAQRHGGEGRQHVLQRDRSRRPASRESSAWRGGAVTAVFVGAPFVDPSGIALMKDGGVLVADTRLFDVRTDTTTKTLGSEAGVILVKDGAASIFATGFATGYPAGIALDRRRNARSSSRARRPTGATPSTSWTSPIHKTPAVVVQDEFSRFQDSSAASNAPTTPTRSSGHRSPPTAEPFTEFAATNCTEGYQP